MQTICFSVVQLDDGYALGQLLDVLERAREEPVVEADVVVELTQLEHLAFARLPIDLHPPRKARLLVDQERPGLAADLLKEPVVFALFLLAGPLWCTLCPLSTAGRLTGRLGFFDRPPPKWMVGLGPWLAILGFVLIVWSERAFRMTRNPRPSGIMLGSLVAAAVVFALFYRREVWCRHLCPLGRLAVALAPASPLQLTAQRSFCASSCQTHECYTGSASIPGCTVFHHPIESKKAHHCKLCLDCLHSCPHGSSRLQLRPPLAAIWRLDAGTRPAKRQAPPPARAIIQTWFGFPG